jgi:hypothetical protein
MVFTRHFGVDLVKTLPYTDMSKRYLKLLPTLISFKVRRWGEGSL